MALALSPDGKRFVYTCLAGGRRQRCLRPMDQIEPTPIAGTEGGYNPFFSPDGEWLGFGAHGKLKKVPVGGGDPLNLCDCPSLRGASWGPDGTILFGTVEGGLSRVKASGGTPQVMTTLDPGRGEQSHRWPEILPGGRAALFAISTTTQETRIAVLTIDSGQRRDVLSGGLYPRYLSSGHLVYWRNGSMWARPFDLERLEAGGDVIPVLENVRASSRPGTAYFEASPAGPLVFLPARRPPMTTPGLVWVDRRGKAQPAPLPRRGYVEGALSPDGRRLAVTLREGAEETTDLMVYDLVRETWTRLTSGEQVTSPVWSSDGIRLVFGSERTGMFTPFWITTDGGGGGRAISRSRLEYATSHLSVARRSDAGLRPLRTGD